MDIVKVGVIGAGQMGTGIAQVCALAGIDVLLNDVSEARTLGGASTPSSRASESSSSGNNMSGTLWRPQSSGSARRRTW